MELLGWVETHRKSLLVGVVAITVAIVAVGLYNWSVEAAESEANEALAASPLVVRGEDTHSDPQALKKVAADYPSTTAGQRAALLAGIALFEEGKFAEAQATYAKLLADHPDGTFAHEASIGVAASLDAQGKNEEALAKYQELTRAGSGAGLVEIKLNMARILEKLNKADQTLAVYDSLASMPAQSASLWEAEVEERRRQLLIDHPDLAKAAAQKAAATATNTPPSKVKP